MKENDWEEFMDHSEDGFDSDELDEDDFSDYESEVASNQDLFEKADASKDATEIMSRYREGKVFVDASEEQIRSLFHLKKKEPITTEMLYGKVPEGISKEDYNELVQTYQKGMEKVNRAKEDMIAKLSMFIYYFMERKFGTFVANHGPDLYQEGVIGILKGIDNYKPELGKPTTFFGRYMLHEMSEYININVNKTTSHYAGNINKVKRSIDAFERAGRDWTLTDIAQETGISAETIAQALNIMKSSNEVHYDTLDFLDTNTSQRSLSPEEEYLKKETMDLVQQAVDALPEEEASVIRLKYGLTGEAPMSYKNISTTLDIQIDRVKKLNNSAIRRLKRSRIINGNFKNLKREEKALNESLIGMVPLKVADQMAKEVEEAILNDSDEIACEVVPIP